MFPHDNRDPSRSGGGSSLTRGLATVCGVVTAYFATPILFDWSKFAIASFTSSHYGVEWAQITIWTWACILAAGCFFGSRVFVFDLLTGGRMRFVRWFF